MNVLHDCVRWHLTVVVGTNITFYCVTIPKWKEKLEFNVVGKLHISAIFVSGLHPPLYYQAAAGFSS